MAVTHDDDDRDNNNNNDNNNGHAPAGWGADGGPTRRDCAPRAPFMGAVHPDAPRHGVGGILHRVLLCTIRLCVHLLN